MRFFKAATEKHMPCEQNTEVSVGRIVFKTVAIATAVLAFVPTVFKVNKGEGFEGFGLLSKIKYEKKPRAGGGYDMNFTYSMIDLERYGIKKLEKSGNVEIIEVEAVDPESVEVEVVEAEVVEAEVTV